MTEERENKRSCAGVGYNSLKLPGTGVVSGLPVWHYLSLELSRALFSLDSRGRTGTFSQNGNEHE